MAESWGGSENRTRSCLIETEGRKGHPPIKKGRDGAKWLGGASIYPMTASKLECRVMRLNRLQTKAKMGYALGFSKVRRAKMRQCGRTKLRDTS